LIFEADKWLYEDGVYRHSRARRDAAIDAMFAGAHAYASRTSVVLCVATCGPPGSGKSTLARAVDDDDLIVLDAVFAKQEDRRRAVALARSIGVPIVVLLARTPLALSLERNSRRSGARRVPDDVVATLDGILAADPPSRADGFEAVVAVEPEDQLRELPRRSRAGGHLPR
jgi:predicted kinase